jgi:isopentenyl phosphate kinase
VSELVFLKLGGSLITDKNNAHNARHEVIERIGDEIARGLRDNPGLKLLLGHGSGSFGHIAARQYGTRKGVETPEEWLGFSVVWREARALNTIVLETLAQAGLPVVGFSPCSQVITASHQIVAWETTQLKLALQNGLLPVVYGDVIFDTEIGGTILSTEEQFEHLAAQLHPSRILLAGIEAGIWKDFPTRSDLYRHITPSNIGNVEKHLANSASPDVTGGMRSKVLSMHKLVRSRLCREVCIFSGQPDGNIYNALSGVCSGTRISQD